jgi:3-methyladenine DNA glycosylase AlkD
MDRWARDFDNWAVCDTVCFHLFDKTPRAWHTIDRWSRRNEEFVRRAAFALLASLALHQKTAPDDRFRGALVLVERHANDDRNFVKKGVLWALRAIGSRGPELRAAAVAVAKRLTARSQASARWIGRQALRALNSPALLRRTAG